MPQGWRLVFLAVAAVVPLAPQARADSAVITSGTIQLYWDGSRGGIDLRGAETHLVAEDTQTAPPSLQAGETADLSRVVRTAATSHPVSATVNGVTYASVWVAGQFTVTAAGFAVPHEALETTMFFSTPIAMTGQFAAYSDQAMSDPLFTVALSGRGVASIGPMTLVAPDTYLLRSGGLVYQFTSCVPVPFGNRQRGDRPHTLRIQAQLRLSGGHDVSKAWDSGPRPCHSTSRSTRAGSLVVRTSRNKRPVESNANDVGHGTRHRRAAASAASLRSEAVVEVSGAQR